MLTRDYLHCFKRATGSATERISDMGQFIFKIKLVDVEKVEWSNRRSYSAIGLFLGNREGRVLLRCDQGLEDWFELLDECTLGSKERRRALRNVQGPRSRASLAAPPSHSSLQTNHMGLGGTYSSALEDWLLPRHKTSHSVSNHHFALSDSVPDLTGFNENCGISTNHSTPQKLPYHNNNSRYSANANGYPLMHNNSYSNGFCGTPQRVSNKNYDDDDNEVQLRRGGVLLGNGMIVGNGHGGNVRNGGRKCENGNDKDEWMYRRPLGPNDVRHSLLTEIDISACDSGLDTPPSTHRPSSYRDVYYMKAGARDSTDTGVSSSRGTLVSPGGSFRAANGNIIGLRNSIQDKILRIRNEEDKLSIRSMNKLNSNELYDPNQNKYYKSNGNGPIMNNSNNNGNGNGALPRYQQHPALAAIINEAQGIKFRDRSYSDIQQVPRRHYNNNSPSPRRRPFMGTPTRV